MSNLRTTLLFHIHRHPVHWKDGDLSRPPFWRPALFKLPSPRLQNRLVTGAYVHNTFLFLYCVLEKVTYFFVLSSILIKFSYFKLDKVNKKLYVRV